MVISSKKWSRITITSFTRDNTIVKVYLRLYWVFSKKVAWAVIMRQFKNLRKIVIFLKMRDLKWEYLPRK